MKLNPGQVAVVTGGASGFGYAIAAQLLERGLKVVIADIRDDALTDAAVELSATGGEVLAVRTDVSDAESVQMLADATLDRFGRVDLVCNNAGVASAMAPMWDQSLETWNWLIGIKMMGVVHGVRSFAPLLLSQGTGHFLNTASRGGLMPLPFMTPYNGTMHAVIGMTETLNQELRSAAPGVGATVLCPGFVETGLAANSAQINPRNASTSSAAPPVVATVVREPVTSADVASAAIAGVEADRVHVITHPGGFPLITARVQSVLDDMSA